MRIRTTVECPGCKYRQEIRAKKPGFMANVTEHVRCSGCDSTYNARMRKIKNNSDQVEITLQVISIGTKLAEIIRARMVDEKAKGA